MEQERGNPLIVQAGVSITQLCSSAPVVQATRLIHECYATLYTEPTATQNIESRSQLTGFLFKCYASDTMDNCCLRRRVEYQTIARVHIERVPLSHIWGLDVEGRCTPEAKQNHPASIIAVVDVRRETATNTRVASAGAVSDGSNGH